MGELSLPSNAMQRQDDHGHGTSGMPPPVRRNHANEPGIQAAPRTNALRTLLEGGPGIKPVLHNQTNTRKGRISTLPEPDSNGSSRASAWPPQPSGSSNRGTQPSKHAGSYAMDRNV
eukprot:13428149-Alexandrium_andersonii.AAC.1